MFEYLVAKLMLRLFGEVWWDYHDKPCNYQGIVCLESTIAWGFYAVIIITFLFDKMMKLIDFYPIMWGTKTIVFVFIMALFDFGYHFIMATGLKHDMGKIYHRFRRK